MARAEALLGLGKHAEAEAAARKAAELDPKSALAYSRLATGARSPQAARPTPPPRARRRPRSTTSSARASPPTGSRWSPSSQQKNWSEAIAQAQQGAFLDPDNPHVQASVGRIFEVNGQLEQAAAAYRKALTVDPAYAPARLALIQAELNRGNRDAALEEAREGGGRNAEPRAARS